MSNADIVFEWIDEESFSDPVRYAIIIVDEQPQLLLWGKERNSIDDDVESADPSGDGEWAESLGSYDMVAVLRKIMNLSRTKR